MPLAYNPDEAEFTVDAVIDDIQYTVKGFNDSGHEPIGPNFTESDGSHKGVSRKKGIRTASMDIEIGNEASPKQFATFDYQDTNWMIDKVGKNLSSTNPGALTLALICTKQPGTVTSVTIGAGGTGFAASGPLVFSGATGQGAAGTFTATAGVITSTTITRRGYGYETAPTVTAAGGSGATLTAVIINPDA